MRRKELEKVLILHKLWLKGEERGKRADLRYADLRSADLRSADLRGAELNNCVGNNKEIKNIMLGTYIVTYTKDIICIGCKTHTLEEWEAFTDEQINEMDSDALEWWKLNKHIVLELARREKQ